MAGCRVVSLRNRADRIAKRALDVLLSGVAIIILSPLLLLIAVILRFTGEREIFYRQQRVGRGGETFPLLKFATMLKDSPNLPGGDITTGNDPRVLPFGRLLRKTKLNELPQLWNVLLGDMALIGPRPLTPRIYDRFPDDYKAAIRSLRPGLSGLGSVFFRDEEALLASASDRESYYVEVIQPYKADLEIWYARHRNIWVDLKLIFLTLLTVARPSLYPTRYFPDLAPPPADLQEAMGR